MMLISSIKLFQKSKTYKSHVISACPISIVFYILFTIVFIQPSAISQESFEYESLIKGMEDFKVGNYQKALEGFFTASKKFPDDPDIPYYIGLTYLQLKNNDKATVFFRNALEIKPEHLNAHFQLGVALIQQDLYKEALKHLEKVWKAEPEREDLGYLLGFVYYQLAEYKKALYYFKAGNTTDKTIKSLTLFYSALAETQESGLTKEARFLFNEVITSDPTSPASSLSHRFVEIQETEKVAKQLSLEFTARAGYDDNVLLFPHNKKLDFLRQRKQSSAFQFVSFRASYMPFTKPKGRLSLSYSANQTIYDSIRNMDVQNHTASLEGLYRGRLGSTNWEIRPGLFFNYFLQNYHSYLSRYSFRMPFLLNESARNTSMVEYDLHVKDYKRNPRSRNILSIPSSGIDDPLSAFIEKKTATSELSATLHEEDRDARTHELGFTHFFHTVDWRHYFKIGYAREIENTNGRNWDYWSNRLFAGAQVSLPFNTKFRGDYIWQKYRYRNTNTVFSSRRNEMDRLYYGSLTKGITKNTNVFFEFTRKRNTSRILPFEYEKNIYSFGVTFKH